MVEKLRRKFIIISVSCVFVVLFIIAGFINLSNYSQIVRHADELLYIITTNDGRFPKPDIHKAPPKSPPKMSSEAPYSTRFFTIKMNENKEPLAVDTGKIFSVSSSQAIQYANKALQSKKESGFINHYKYRMVQKSYGTLIVFIDCSRELAIFRSFLANSLLICLAGIAAVFVLVLIFSKKAIAPVAESYQKQKQFITDASHELKTPLAIISTNTEVLELDYGESEWTQSTRHQVARLSKLVSNLVSLTAMDEESHEPLKVDFPLSDVVSETLEPFIEVAQTNGNTLIPQIEKGLSYYGNEKAIRQLVYILLDNAIKYSSAGSSIVLSLKKQGKKYILQTENQAPHLEKGPYNVLFERFYRADQSHNSQTGGHGIGLSIAKAIVLKHKGKITAQSPDGKKLIISAQF